MTFGINKDGRATPLRFNVHVICYKDDRANAPENYILGVNWQMQEAVLGALALCSS